MGVEVAIAGVALAVSGAAAYEQSRQASKAAKDRKEARSVAQAEQNAQMNQNRRQQLREERVKRAQILQSSQNTGVSASSGEVGATSALGSLVAGNLAGMSRQQNSANAIGGLEQSAANADLAGATWGAVGNFSSSIFGLSAGAALDSMKKPPTTVKPTATSSQNIFQ